MPHTVPNRPMNGADAATVASTLRISRSAPDFARDLRLHQTIDAREHHLRGVARKPRAARFSPFARCRRIDAAQSFARLIAAAIVHVVHGAAGPKLAFVFAGVAFQLAELQPFVDGDAPRPDRGDRQDQHHAFDDRVGLQE